MTYNELIITLDNLKHELCVLNPLKDTHELAETYLRHFVSESNKGYKDAFFWAYDGIWYYSDDENMLSMYMEMKGKNLKINCTVKKTTNLKHNKY